MVSKNEARNIRILGRVIILAVGVPLLGFSLFVLNGPARPTALFGIVIAAYVLSVVVDKIAKRKTPPSPSEVEKY